MLMKLTAAFNFTNSLHAAFALKDDEIPKVQKGSQVISAFLHFWDLRAKNYSLNVDKIDTCCQFHRHLHNTKLLHQFSSIKKLQTQTVSRKKAGQNTFHTKS